MLDDGLAPIPVRRSWPAIGFQIMDLDPLLGESWSTDGQIIVGPRERQLFRHFLSRGGVRRQIIENKKQKIEKSNNTAINLICLPFSIFWLCLSKGVPSRELR